MTAADSEYKSFWDEYSREWESSVRKPGQEHLGDEWGDAELIQTIIDRYVKPHLPQGAVALEIGCGGGKYSECLAPLCRVLICTDVSASMLARTRTRLGGARNVIFEESSGFDLRQFEDDLVDYVFSFDCFVHIDIEDVYCYLQEIRRVLKPGGTGLLHFANLTSEAGWRKFTGEAPLNQGSQKSIARFRFLTWEIVERFFRFLHFEIVDSLREPWRDILMVFANGKSTHVVGARDPAPAATPPTPRAACKRLPP